MDANLIVLLVSGLTSKSYIARQRRLREFTTQDFDLLVDFIKPYAPIVVTPNTLTEASNIIDYMQSPVRERVAASLKTFITSQSEERFVISKRAAEMPEFLNLGLSDCALLAELDGSRVLLTTDLSLFEAGQRRGFYTNTINFNHYRIR